jgi:hypothetical protein
MPPSISTRAFIQWLPDKPSEPTSTKVLTTSQRHFVDIRVITKDAARENVDPTHVEWAFAGHSTSQVIDGRTLSQWHHWIDSKTSEPEGVVDKGEMLPEDAEGLAMEKGEMVNPATGKLTEYVEGWRDGEIEIVAKPGGDVIQGFWKELRGRGVSVEGLRKEGEMGSSKSKDDEARLSIVLQHEDVARKPRGMVVRLGQMCQGVMRVGDEFAHERWEWAQNDGWRRTSVSGTLSLPCDVLTMLGEEICTGTKVTYGDEDDLKWQCVEAEQF